MISVIFIVEDIASSANFFISIAFNHPHTERSLKNRTWKSLFLFFMLSAVKDLSADWASDQTSAWYYMLSVEVEFQWHWAVVKHKWWRRKALKLLHVLIGLLREPNQCLSPHRFCCETSDVCEHHFQVIPFDLKICEIFPKTETIRYHNSRASNPSNLSPVSNEMISDSVELWETAVCFLHI